MVKSYTLFANGVPVASPSCIRGYQHALIARHDLATMRALACSRCDGHPRIFDSKFSSLCVSCPRSCRFTIVELRSPSK